VLKNKTRGEETFHILILRFVASTQVTQGAKNNNSTQYYYFDDVTYFHDNFHNNLPDSGIRKTPPS